MSDIPQQTNLKQPAQYVPGMFAMPSNPELGQLLGLFAGQVLGPMFGAENFLPHLTSGGIGPMDQYAMRHFQMQQMSSANAISTANVSNVASRLLAARTFATAEPATEQTKNQADNIAHIINHPILKGIIGQIVGPETFEAMLHGTKGDVAQLHSATMRAGYFRRGPDGSRRMDAEAMEEFSRGVYAHLYEEGGDFDRLVEEAQDNSEPEQQKESRRRLKRAARVGDDIEIVTDADFMQRVDTNDIAEKDKINAIYKKFVQGTETDTIKQAEAISKIQPAVQATGLLKENEMMLSAVRQQAEKVKVGELHGLMAGQVGQLEDYMMHRGLLPQALGAMSAADRVKLMGSDLDSATLRRLAETEATQELQKNKDYVAASPTEQKNMLQAARERHEEEIKKTHSAIQSFNSNAAGSGASVADLEKMGGFEAIAGNIDAQRTANALKNYAGAVDAVREIFGENGNHNAPMPALLAALDHLTHGANFQMSPKSVEATLRQMQMTARDAGIGFEQMAAMSGQMGAMGKMLGVAEPTVMQDQVNAMALIRTMRDSGAFASPGFGSMGQAEATQLVAQKMIAADASPNARAAAAAAGIYADNKEAFDPNSEFSRAMEAYLSGKNTYETATGEVKNLAEVIGLGGPLAVQQLFAADEKYRGTPEELYSAMRSPQAMSRMQAGFGLQTALYDTAKLVNNNVVFRATDARIQEFADSDNQSALAQQSPEAVSSIFGSLLSGLLIETAPLNDAKDRLSAVQRELPTQLQNEFKAKLGVDDATAAQLAQEAMQAVLGTGDQEQQRRLSKFQNDADTFVFTTTGGKLTLKKLGTILSGNKVGRAMADVRADAHVAQRRAEISYGLDSNPFGRVSDELLRAGMTGQRVTANDLLREFLNIIPNKELAERYVSDMRAGLNSTTNRLSEITYTDKYIENLATQNTAAADKELLTLAEKAGVSNVELENTAETDLAGAAAAEKLLTTGSDDEITQAYLAASGNTSTTEPAAKLRQYLRGSTKTAQNFQQQQARTAFFKQRAAQKLDGMSDDEVQKAYAAAFNADPGAMSPAAQRSALVDTDYGINLGAAVPESGGTYTRQELADKVSAADAVRGRLRDDAKNAGATQKELDFLQRYSVGVFDAANEKTRKTLIDELVSTYKLADVTPDDGIGINQELEQLVGDVATDKDKLHATIDTTIAQAMRAGNADVTANEISLVQTLARTANDSARIDPARSGISGIGDITTATATINATNVDISGATGAEKRPDSKTPATDAAEAPVSSALPGTEQNKKKDAPDPNRAAAAVNQASGATAVAQQKDQQAAQRINRQNQNANNRPHRESIEITGSLNITNLETAVITAYNKQSRARPSAGDLDVYTDNVST